MIILKNIFILKFYFHFGAWKNYLAMVIVLVIRLNFMRAFCMRVIFMRDIFSKTDLPNKNFP